MAPDPWGIGTGIASVITGAGALAWSIVVAIRADARAARAEEREELRAAEARRAELESLVKRVYHHTRVDWARSEDEFTNTDDPALANPGPKTVIVTIVNAGTQPVFDVRIRPAGGWSRSVLLGPIPISISVLDPGRQQEFEVQMSPPAPNKWARRPPTAIEFYDAAQKHWLRTAEGSYLCEGQDPWPDQPALA